MARSQEKAGVSEQALVQRINRVLAKRGEKLRRCRQDSRSFSNLGSYYMLDVNRNIVVDSHVNPAVLGRKLGVLREGEKLS